jgi:4-hydroxybenzoate polyprenyltransferase
MRSWLGNIRQKCSEFLSSERGAVCSKCLDRAREYALLIRLDRPIGIFLLLWPTLWALWIASKGQPDGQVFLVFVLGVFLMRSAGCVINDIADRKVDPAVQRTRNRPIAAGRVSVREAWVLFVVLCLLAFMLVLLMNRLTILLSLVAVVLAATYPFMKRYTYLPQVHLGLAFGWAVPMVFAAQTGALPKEAWLLLTSTVLWATAYDTMYAMVDREDDIRIGVKSTAILFGSADRIIIALIQVMLIWSLYLLGKQTAMAMPYYVGLAVAACFAVYQDFLIRRRDRAQCLMAFLNNNYFGAAIFAGIVVNYM